MKLRRLKRKVLNVRRRQKQRRDGGGGEGYIIEEGWVYEHLQKSTSTIMLRKPSGALLDYISGPDRDSNIRRVGSSTRVLCFWFCFGF